MEVRKINSAKARRSFATLLNETGFGHDRTVITRKGKAIAAMVPLEDLEAIQELENKKDIAEAERILSDPKSEFIPWKQAKKELLNN